MKMNKLKLPNTFVLLALILGMICAASWLAPGGRYGTREAAGKTVIDPDVYQALPAVPQGISELLQAPVKGFTEAGLIIGFVLITGGAFSVLQKTQAIDAAIAAMARAGERSAWVRQGFIPLFVSLFSLGGATFGMNEEAIPFVLIFVPLALALGYDSLVGVAIPFLGSQVGFASAFLNPFNVGIAQGIAGVPLFSGVAYRFLVWLLATAATAGFLMWHAARVKRRPAISPVAAIDRERSASQPAGEAVLQMNRRHRLVLLAFAGALLAMVAGVVLYHWFIEQIAALFLGMAIVIGLVARLDADALASAFIDGARDMVGTALVIALARASMVLARDAQLIDAMLHALMPLVASSSPVLAAQKMFLVQSVINFFIHSGSGQAALTMPIMAPLADLVGVSRQTAILAFQFGEFTTPIIPTSGITVGVLALARIPWIVWVRWMLPLQLIYLVLALGLLAPACLISW